MAIKVYIVKRRLRERRKNGQHKHVWALRWQDPLTGKFPCESTGTADKVQAESLAKIKWAELNGLTPPEPDVEPIPEPAALPTWDDCRNALQRAMEADNLRPSYVADALIALDVLKRTFPELASPALVTSDMANEYKRRRSETKKPGSAEGAAEFLSPWSIRGDLSTLRAIFGKWLRDECGLLASNPFEKVRPPKCDDPDVRIVSAAETVGLFAWLAERWHKWPLPQTYLEIAALLGWRATEIASIREEDILPDGFVRVIAGTSKTRKQKIGWLPEKLHKALRECVADGWAFGRFSDDLRRRLILGQRRHHAARVGDFTPERLVGWLQDELQRFHDHLADEAGKAEKPAPERFTLHDFRRTAITGLQMAGVTEKEASVMVGATPEVMRKHYEKLDQQAIARRSVGLRLGIVADEQSPQSLRAGCAQ
jgi:integrase